MAAAAAFAGLIRARPAAVGREILPVRSPCPHPPPPGRRVCKGGGRNCLLRPKPVWPKNCSKRPSSGSTGFGEFSRVLEFKMSVLGAMVLFGMQNYVYIGPRVAFR